MKIIYSLLLILGLAVNIQAQEVITEYSPETLSVLNNELRNIAADIRSANARITTVNSTLSQAIPSGIITIWSGTIATMPSGWYLCNGSNGTPDLRDRFIVGATADNSGVANTNVTGSLTQSGNGSIPAHVHSISGATVGGAPIVPYYVAGTVNAGTDTGSYGTGTKNIAVYYALAFIQKS